MDENRDILLGDSFAWVTLIILCRWNADPQSKCRNKLDKIEQVSIMRCYTDRLVFAYMANITKPTKEAMRLKQDGSHRFHKLDLGEFYW